MNRIRDLRLNSGLKQIELAKALSVSQAALSGYETGKYEPDFDTLKKIADYFSVSVDYVLGRDEAAPSAERGPGSGKDQLMAAFWGGEKDLTQEDLEDMWDDVERFAAFLAEKKRQEKKAE